MFKTAVTVLLALSLLPGCFPYLPWTSQQTALPELAPPADLPENYTTYNGSNVFSISYPADWEISRMLMLGYRQSAENALTNLRAGVPVAKSAFLLMCGKRLSTKEYMPHLFILVEPRSPSQPTLEAVVDDSEQDWRNNYDYKRLSRTNITVGGREATIVDWEGTLKGDQDKLHYMQLHTTENETVWIVTCTATAEDYSLWQNDFNIILTSLRIAK